jgi:type VI secretion system secreted protein VgrG
LREAVPFRSERVTPPARQAGLQIGAVVGEPGAEVFPDAEGRVRVQHHWDREGTRDDRSGTWMRVAQRNNADSMLIPRIGWNVATFNDEGSIDAPSVLRRFHDGEHPPSYPLPANKTRVVYKTATTPGGGSFNEVHFEDKAGAERMFWNASRDMDVLVQNDDTELVVNDARRAVTRDEFTDVTGNHATQVDGAQTVKIAQNETITVSGSSDKTVLGDEKNTIGGKRSVTAGDSHTTSVTKTRKLQVGVAQVDVTLGPVSAQAKTYSLLVGGAIVRITAKSLADAAGWASAQTIGAAKIEAIKGARSTKVKKRLIETAGGAMVLDSGKDFSDKSDKTASFTAAAAMKGDAPTVTLEATEKLTLSVGSTSVTLEPSKVTIASTKFKLGTSSTFVVTSPKVSHN